MAWTAPKTDFAPGDILNAAQMNEIGENLDVLHTPVVTALPGSAAEGDNVLLYNSTAENYIPHVYAGSGPGWKATSLGSNPPSVRCAANGTQSVNFLTSTTVLWEAADLHDTCAMHNPSVNAGLITIKQTGVYAISCGLVLNAAPGGVFDVVIFRNGATFLAGTRGPDVDRTALSTQASLTLNDTLEVSLFIQNTRTVGANPISHFAATMISRV